MAAGGRSRKNQVVRVQSELEQLEYKLADMGIEVDRRCEKLESSAREAACALRSALGVQLSALPPSVRSMPVGDFIGQYGGDLRAAVMASMRQRGAGSKIGRAHPPRPAGGRAPPRPGGVGRPPRAGTLAAATPAHSRSTAASRPFSAVKQVQYATPAKFNPALPATPSVARAAKSGEVLLSANGSPLQAPAVARASVCVSGDKENDAAGADAASVAIDLELMAGKSINVSDPSVAGQLSTPEKQAAMERLAALQQQVAAVMATLKK